MNNAFASFYNIILTKMVNVFNPAAISSDWHGVEQKKKELASMQNATIFALPDTNHSTRSVINASHWVEQKKKELASMQNTTFFALPDTNHLTRSVISLYSPYHAASEMCDIG